MPRLHDDFLEWQRLRAGPLGAQLETFAGRCSRPMFRCPRAASSPAAGRSTW